MPIRTQRGRTAVYRRLWGWPLTSYRHLAATLAGLAVAAILLGVALGASKETPQPPRQHPRVPVAASPSQPPAHANPMPPAPHRTVIPPPTPSKAPQPPPPPEALQVADDFAHHFADHPTGMGAAEWAQQLRRNVTPETGGMLETVDPTTVDITEVTGPPTATHVALTVVHVAVPTNAGALQLVTVHTDTGWLVRSWDKAGG